VTRSGNVRAWSCDTNPHRLGAWIDSQQAIVELGEQPNVDAEEVGVAAPCLREPIDRRDATYQSNVRHPRNIRHLRSDERLDP
jgi:hypothetical protein